MKDVNVIKLPNHIERGIPETNIIAVGESVAHIYKVSRAYLNEIKKLRSEDSKYAQPVGSRDDDYIMVLTRPIALHLVTTDSKEEHDVKGMLLDVASPEEEKEYAEELKEELSKKRKPKRFSKKWAKKVANAPDT